MKVEKMSSFSGGMLWFGAAVSIAEIFTGALLAPLGLTQGLLAIVLGHVIGGALMYSIGIIGANSGLSAMESTGMTFGRGGSIFFSVLNILQLLGWTAVMIISGANAMNTSLNVGNPVLWSIVIGLMIALWIAVGIRNISKINLVAVGSLFLLSIVMGVVVFKSSTVVTHESTLSFALAIELSIAMPVSWLPLISDYTKHAKNPISFTLTSTVAYFIGSCFMYAIGLGAAIYTGSSDVVALLSASGLGVAAMLIAVLSTVTTTYLDVYSAGESMMNIHPFKSPKAIGLGVCAIGTAIAIFMPIRQYENFLYLIGSVFVPMAAIMIADEILVKGLFKLYKRDTEQHQTHQRRINQKHLQNSLLWLVGFITYRILLTNPTPIGSTLPVIALLFALSLAINTLNQKVKS